MAKNLIALESVVLQLNSNWALAKSSRGGTKEWLAPRSFQIINLKIKHSRTEFRMSTKYGSSDLVPEGFYGVCA